jgi:NAD(P)-dependent dehydrogenase (short-subunit alcohol dehydrogenase family)
MATYKKTDIRGLVAFVTGASSGIGRACCVELARRGCTVAAVARSQDVCESMHHTSA